MTGQKQVVITIGHDRKLKRCSKPIFGEWLFDESDMLAWFTLRKLYPVFTFLKGKMGLVIDSRFALPLNPYHDYNENEITNLTGLDKRADLALNVAMGQAEKQGRQHIIAWGLIAIVSGLVVCVIILALLVASGRM